MVRYVSHGQGDDVVQGSATDDVKPGVRLMRLRRNGVCACGRSLPAGSRAGWDRVSRVVVCDACLAAAPRASTDQPPVLIHEAKLSALEPEQAEIVAIDVARPSDAGASLSREADRRTARREARVRQRFPRLGGVILAISGEEPTAKAFRTGAEGERKAVERILGRCGGDVTLLLNRRLGVGRTDGDIDLLAISAAGVHVIDIKHHKGATIEVRKSGGLLAPRTEHLIIGGRDRTSLLTSMHRQIEAVASALAGLDRTTGLDIIPTLCFVDADLPLLRKLRVDGIEIRGSREMGKRLRSAKGPLSADERDMVHRRLAEALPPA